MKRTCKLFYGLSLVLSTQCLANDLMAIDQFRSFVADKKAYRLGDTVTILIAEQSRAASSADTNSNKDMGFRLAGFDSVTNAKVGGEVGSGWGGDATTQRRGFLQGQITVAVVDINKLGHLVVRGEQTIVINGEEQSIKIKGTLRPEDISEKNTAVSNRLTDAKIEFSGQGDVSDAQRKGVIATVLGWLGLL